MTDTTTPRYGRRKVTGMIANVEALRRQIRAEGTPAIQSAWDAVEEHQDAAYQWAGERATVIAVLNALAHHPSHEDSAMGRRARAALAKLGG